MTGSRLFLLIVAFLGFIVASNSLYTVKESERAVLLRFREVVQNDLQPGLHFKVPFIDQVLRFDGRVQSAYILEGDYLTLEKKLLLVDSYAMWKVSDVEQFYTATRGLAARAIERLVPRVNEALRNEFGKRTVYEVVAGERDELMVHVLEQVNQAAQEELGIEILDIRVKKIDLPQTVSEDVYKRMRAERARDAREHRSQGREIAEGIRADAERQQRIILAEAYKQAQKIRGEGDATAATIYAESYQQDPEFFRFYRSLEGYRKSFSGQHNLMVVDPNGDFFNYIDSMK
ncbi:MAG: protease modulator HflC [Pseudomonadota bacterium]|nr:protease modulator HflC [Pseudomonadota bacterium]